jgi:hypothetical protein
MQKLLLWVILLHAAQTLCAQEYQITVSAGAQPRSSTPLEVKVEQTLDKNKQYELINKKTGKKAAVQQLKNNTIVFILPDAIAANQSSTYTLAVSSKKKSSPIRIVEENDQLKVYSNNKPVFVYHKDIVSPPADSPSYYRRSGFIHPLYSPNGAILSDDFPAGHAHQHGLFASWTNTTFKNEFVDFWNQHLQKGTVEHIKVLGKEEGPVCARVDLLLRYKSLQFGEVLQERWTITVYPFSDYFLFDLKSEQTNTSSDTLYLNKYHYGGMAFRGSRSWNPDDKTNFQDNWNVLTNEGIRDSAANHTHAKWVDVSGKIGKLTAGVTIFDHPSNFRYPQAIRVHPKIPYWAYAPVVDGPFTIDPGKKYYAQFRYYVHNGTPDIRMVERLEKDYSVPPLVTLK